MKLVHSHNRVIELMSRFEKQVEYSAAMSKTDINRAAQNILIPLFEEIYGYKNLKNLDYVEDTSNYPSIDLGDEVEKIAFQITSTTTVKKIQDTLQKFVKYNLHQKYNRLIIYILTNKQGTYSDTKIKQIIENTGCSFDVDNDIWDHKTLLKEIGDFQVEKIDAIKNILERNFGNEINSNSLQTLINSQIECLLKQQGINTNISYTTANPILDIPPLVENLSTRKETVKLLIDSFENYSWVAIHGSIGLGKTQLAILIAQELNIQCVWIRFRDMTIDKACIRLDAACSELIGYRSQNSRYEWYSQLCEKIGSGAMIVLDDLPRLSNSDELSERLIQLANACEANQVKLLSTSHFSFPNSFVSSIGQKLYQLSSPLFSDFEVTEVLQSYGASSSFATGIAKFINALAHQHPLIINAIAKYLADKKWQFTEIELEGLYKNDYIEELNDETIERILSSIKELETKELLYRLILIDGVFSIEDVQGLAYIEPQVIHPNDRLAKLIGLWIQRDAEHRYLASPLTKRLNSGNLTPATKRNCHLWIAERIIHKHQLDQFDVLRAFNHFYSAEAFNRAGHILVFALGHISHKDIQVEHELLSAIWIHKSLPAQMDLSIRIFLRGLQIVVNHKYGKDILYLLGDLDSLIQKASEKEAFSIVAATLYVSMTVAQGDPVLANRYLLTSLKFLPQARLPDGSELVLSEDNQPEQIAWVTSMGVTTIEHLHDWIETINQLTIIQRNRVFTSEITEKACLALLDRIYQLENAKPQDQQQWQLIINAIEEFAYKSFQLKLELLFGCSIRLQIIVLVKHCSNLETAISLAEIAMSQGVTDQRALLLIQECIGRYCLEAHQYDQALVWLSLARNLDVNAYPYIQLDVLLNSSFAIGKNDPQNSIQYLLQAINLAKSSSEIASEEDLAKIFGELAIAYWLAGDLEYAFDALEKACEILLSIKADTDDWAKLLLRLSHVSGYLTSLAINDNPSITSGKNQLYPAPLRAVFYGNSPNLEIPYNSVLESSLASQLARYAGAVGKDNQSIKWAMKGFDIVRQTKQYFTLPLLAEFVVPQMVLENRYSEALELALEAGNILSGILGNQQNQNSNEIVKSDLEIIPVVERNYFRKQVEEYAVITGLVPIAFHLGTITINEPNLAQKLGLEVAVLCREITDISIEQYWLKLATLFEDIYSNKSSSRELLNLGNIFISKDKEKNTFLDVLSIVSHLGASLHPDISLENAFKVHLHVTHYLYFSLKPLASTTYKNIILPFLSNYWTTKFKKKRFLFRSPQIIERDLAEVTTFSYEQRAQKIFEILAFGLDVSIPNEFSSWLQIKP
jgi:hypothetical protein